MFVLWFCFFNTFGDGKESQMGSGGHHPGCHVEDHFAMVSSTLGPLGETPQSVSRCQLGEEGCKVEEFGSGTPVQSPCAENCANPASQSPSVRQSPPEVFTAARAKVLRLEAALSALEDADTVEKENLERVLQRARTQPVVPPISEQIIATQGFIERERKRLAAAEEAVHAAVKNWDESHWHKESSASQS